MTWILGALTVVLVVAALAALWRQARTRAAPGPRRRAWDPPATSRAPGRITLDLAGVDPDDDAVQRLVGDAAARALAADPDLAAVEVFDRDGHLLGREERGRPREIALPEHLHVEHGPSRHAPSPVPRHADDALPPDEPRPGDEPRRRIVPGPAPQVQNVALADRLDLAPAIRSHVRHPDRPTDVLHAILLAAGLPSQVDGDLVRCGEVAIAVVDPRHDAEAALTHGFLRIEATDAARGLILRTGYADPRLVRRRDAAAPHVRHLGPDAFQRMADAAAVGADPLAFAAGPAAVR